jgi:hypothetical protein
VTWTAGFELGRVRLDCASSEKKTVVERPMQWYPDFLDGGLIEWKVEKDIGLV